MKKLFTLLLITIIYTSCSKDENEVLNNSELTGELIGKWKLIELYNPSNGSDYFLTVNSERTIEFFKNRDVVSNGTLCDMSSDTGATSTGIVDTGIKAILPNEVCSYSAYRINYRLEDGKLQLWYQCAFGCAQKFEKVRS